MAFISALLAVGLLQWRHADARMRMRQVTSTSERMAQARLRATRAYLIARHARDRNQTFDLADAAAQLDAASLAIRAWLSRRDVPRPLLGPGRRDPELRRLVVAYGRSIADFRSQLLAPRPSDVEVRASFATLERQADAVDRRMHAVLAAAARREERDHAITVFLFTFFVLATGVLLREVGRRRDEARGALAESEARLRLLVSQLPALSWTTDDQLRIRSVFGALRALLPGDPASLEGQLLSDVMAESTYAERAVAAHRDALRGQLAQYDIRVADRYLSVRVEPLRDRSGATLGVVAVAIDVSERRQLEASLHRARKMEAIGRLAGGVAHDFNNVLAVIRLNADLLGSSLDASDDRQVDIREMVSATERGSRLIRQLLIVGRQQPQQRQPIDLARLAHDMAPMLGKLAGGRIAVELRAELDRAWVAADLSQMEQVLLNLVSNASDAISGRGSITVVVEQAPAALVDAAPAVPPGDYVMLTVSDTGVGMDRETREQIFDPFFTTKRDGEGTGLGLATVYGIVRQSGGTIEVESEPGRGTRFTILLPRAAASGSG